MTGFGIGRECLMAELFRGASAVLPLRRLAHVAAGTRVASELPETVLRAAGCERRLPFFMARDAAVEALREAGQPDRRTLGIVLASTKAELSGVVGPGDGLGSGARLLTRLAGSLGIHGRRLAVSCACASGLSALAVAGRWIASGVSDRVLVIGVDALSEFVLRGFGGLMALDEGPCRPFDRERKGLSLGEAAGAIVLSADSSESLGVRLAGSGESNEAHHLTGPCREGDGLLLAAHRALSAAGMTPEDIGYIHLHGTGTPYNDSMEGRALARLFGKRTPPASGSKSQIGHTLGAAGVVESLIAVEALLSGEAPANQGLQETDVDSALNLLRSSGRLERGNAVLKLCGGFGGINAALVFAR